MLYWIFVKRAPNSHAPIPLCMTHDGIGWPQACKPCGGMVCGGWLGRFFLHASKMIRCFQIRKNVFHDVYSLCSVDTNFSIMLI